MILITDRDYRLNGYHKKETFDSKGDFSTIEYFKNFDGTNYSGLEVRETRAYTRDVTTGLLTQRTILIEWISNGEVIASKTLTKYYTATKGHTANKKARQNLINDASMYLFAQVGKVDATNFWKIERSSVNDYVNTSDLTIITEIDNSTESYMTQTIKDTLTSILNIVY